MILQALKEMAIDISMTCALMSAVGLPVFVAFKFGENVSLVIFTPIYILIMFAGNLRRNCNVRCSGK